MRQPQIVAGDPPKVFAPPAAYGVSASGTNGGSRMRIEPIGPPKDNPTLGLWGAPSLPYLMLPTATLPRYPSVMERARDNDLLSEDELTALLERALDDEREGRIVHCANEQELRDYLQGLRREAS